MARNLPDANGLIKCFRPAMQTKLEKIVEIAEAAKMSAVHMYAADYDEMITALAGSGFDVARGFKVAGRKAMRYTG